MDRVLRTAGWYFLLQAAAVAGWWVVLALRPQFRVHFQADPASEAALLAFWLPDLVVLAGASLAAGVAALRRHPLAPAAAFAAAAACAYATLYCLAGPLLTGHGWWGFALMAPAALVSAALAVAIHPAARSLLRQARPASPRRHLARTGAQIVVFWSVLLLVFPVLLLRLQGELGIPVLRFPAQAVVGSTLFAMLSGLGLWSGAAMALHGDGTPLPLASARRLVVAGPYAYLRNPMALAGLGQGMAVALLSGSAVVAAYVLLGSALWQWVARPLEEEDLARWFGDEYARYRSEVRCWIPRRTPFGAPAPLLSASRS
jgi:protein-S-isoprenylcysteine O-methyltransferase Ste14